MPPILLNMWISQWLLFICALLVSVIIGLIYLQILRRNRIRNQLPISIEEEYTRKDGKLIETGNVCPHLYIRQYQRVAVDNDLSYTVKDTQDTQRNLENSSFVSGIINCATYCI